MYQEGLGKAGTLVGGYGWCMVGGSVVFNEVSEFSS